MTELSYSEKMKLPKSLFFDPVSGRAAAYDGFHMRIAESASAELVAYGLAHCIGRKPWDRSYRTHAPNTHDLPAWATDEVIDRAEIVWVRAGGLTDERWLAIPPR